MAAADGTKLQCMEVWGGNEPARESISLGGLDAWVEARPCGDAAAGGDVHYLSSCATGRITRLFLADVSGHGDGVAEVARLLRTLMREHVNHLEQLGFVRRMNEAFTRQSKANVFATAIVCTYFGPTGELHLCNAGHPPPLLYRAAARRWQLLDADEQDEDVEHEALAQLEPPTPRTRAELPAGSNIPLGILDLADYAQFRLHLRPGDRVLCYTDSLIEARDVATGEMLTPDGVLAIANALSAGGDAIDTFVGRLVDALDARVGSSLNDDDVTIVLFTPDARGGRVPLATRLAAPFRIVGRTLAWRGQGLRRIPLPEFTVANLAGAVFGPLSRFGRRG